MALLSIDPWETLDNWYREAEQAGELMLDAMALATVDASGKPRSRMVLYKGRVEGKAAFFTNYESAKAHEMDGEPRVALTFHFRSLTRQVRIEGLAVKLSPEASDTYFASRPRESQIGAWASPQSRPIVDRGELLQRAEAVRARFEGAEVARPEFWGGYGVEAEVFEFWIAGEFRLNERFVYTKTEASWAVQQLAP